MTGTAGSAGSTRTAHPGQRQTLIDVLVEAFLGDPFWHHLLPDPERPGFGRADAVAPCMTADIDAYLGLGHCYVIDDRAAAVWSPPGVRADDAAVAEQMGRHADPAVLAEAIPRFIEMAQWRPEEPHFYLHLIGATDAARGRGLGSALLRRVLDVCDHDGYPAYLEASTLRSAALYERHGFEQLATIDFAPGVALHPMLRAPT